jgi:hypothetical protein
MDERKPGERNEYRLEYRPVREYVLPERQPDPPPILPDGSPPPPRLAPSPPVTNQPIARPARPARRRRRVQRPLAVSIGLFLLWGVWFMFWGLVVVGLWLNVSLITLVVGGSPSLLMLVFGLGVVGAVGWGVMLFLGWLFDELTEYRIQVIAEGTARALGELE